MRKMEGRFGWAVCACVLGLLLAWGIGQIAAGAGGLLGRGQPAPAEGRTQAELEKAFQRSASGPGRYQAVSDGAGGFYLYDTVEPDVLKHVWRGQQGLEARYEVPQMQK